MAAPEGCCIGLFAYLKHVPLLGEPPVKILENIDTAPCVKNLTLEVDSEQLCDEIEETYEEFSQKVDVPGFRRGRAPRKILKMRYGRHLEKQAMQQAAEKACEDAFKELDIRTASTPQVDELGDIEEGSGFTFKVNVEYFPDFELADYTDIKPDTEDVKVTEKEVVERLEELRKTAASFIAPAEPRGVQEADIVTINSQATIDGEPFEEATVEDARIEVGSDRYLPGIEENLVGMEKDEEKDITITIPDNYPVEDRRGKEAVMHVKVTDIRERVLPELDDEFAKDLGDFETLDALKDHIRASLEAGVELRQIQLASQAVRDELLNRNQFSLPPSMIEARFNYINSVQQMDDRMAGAPGRGSDGDTGLMAENREQAEKESRLTLILDEIAKKENIEVTPEEYASYISQLAQHNQSDPVWYYQQIEQHQLRNYYERLALEEKVVAHVRALGAGEIESNAKNEDDVEPPESDESAVTASAGVTEAEMSDPEADASDAGASGKEGQEE